jgi:uncharacterized membrane protein
MPEADKTVEEGKIWAFIGYWWILFLVPLLGKKDNKFAVFHGKQGMILFCAYIANFIVSLIFSWIPVLNVLISAIVCTILYIAFVVLAIIGMIKSLTGDYWKMPILGDIAEKINI